jgi:Lar family restriction alleviation protein
MTNLLNCPFCGSEKVGMSSEHDSDTGGVFLSIKCSGCRASSGAGFSTDACPQTYQEVRDEWNRRATPIEQPATVPQAVIDALRFYAHGHHYNIDDDHQQFDTVSGEPQNWLFSERDDDCTMIEDGSIAKAALCGVLQGFEEPPEPIEGEVIIATPIEQAVGVRVPEGYALVPMKPSDAMQAAGAQAVRMDTPVLNRIWTANAVFRAMVDAAPSNGDQEASA